MLVFVLIFIFLVYLSIVFYDIVINYYYSTDIHSLFIDIHCFIDLSMFLFLLIPILNFIVHLIFFVQCFHEDFWQIHHILNLIFLIDLPFVSIVILTIILPIDPFFLFVVFLTELFLFFQIFSFVWWSSSMFCLVICPNIFFYPQWSWNIIFFFCQNMF